MLALICRFLGRHLLAAEWQQLSCGIRLELQHQVASEPAIPLIVQQLLVSGEDHRHGRHPGYDLVAIGRALWRRASRGSHEGASTIEQQIVRVLTGRYERTLRRKVREILLASLVTSHFQKHLLPALYLTIGYYGWRMNGYQEACRRLCLATSIPLTEAAMLVARLKYPEPRVVPPTRVHQIRLRARHLAELHHRHLNDGTYIHLQPEAPSPALLSRVSHEGTRRIIPEPRPAS